MIYIQDDFFGKEVFSMLQEYCLTSDFVIQKAGEKEFSVLPTPESIIPLLKINGYDLILTFIRKAYKGFDNDLRIHADNVIQGEKSAIASVIYINPVEGVTKNGTAFYTHKDYGIELPKNTSDEEFDNLIVNHSNEEKYWEENAKINSIPNRNLTYRSNLFHSKFPKEIKEGERIVLVCFYKISKDS